MDDLWDLKVLMLLPRDLKSVSSFETFDMCCMDEWLEFKNRLRASNFKTSVARWCEHMQRLLCEDMAKERDCYKQHIQAKNPNKRIKIVEGQVQIQRAT